MRTLLKMLVSWLMATGRTLLKKTGPWFMVIGFLVILLSFYWKTFGSLGMYGLMIFGAGCMIVFRRHKSVFNWD